MTYIQSKSDIIEQQLISDILRGRFPVGSSLPLERDLAADLGVGRPMLREVLQRLARDGWITIRKGRGTKVNDYLRTGSLNILGAIVGQGGSAARDFIHHLLEVRAVLLPAAFADAVEASPAKVVATLAAQEDLGDDPDAFARFDWAAQTRISQLGPNPIYFLILRSFDPFYVDLARRYFEVEAHRAASLGFYRALLDAAMACDPEAAAAVTGAAMRDSVRNWQRLSSHEEDAS